MFDTCSVIKMRQASEIDLLEQQEMGAGKAHSDLDLAKQTPGLISSRSTLRKPFGTNVLQVFKGG